MWNNNDKNGFINLSKNNIGQILENSKFAKVITQLCNDKDNKNFLEIGTWNGLGSTKIFVNNLLNRNDDYIFYSLECNKEKSEFAKNLYKAHEKINILNEVIWNKEPKNFGNIYNKNKLSPFDGGHYMWNDSPDKMNIENCKVFIERTDLPDTWDVILFDGGTQTTYFDYLLLKDKCKNILLDDINIDEYKIIVNDIEKNKKFKIIIKDNERNGFLWAKLNTYL